MPSYYYGYNQPSYFFPGQNSFCAIVRCSLDLIVMKMRTVVAKLVMSKTVTIASAVVGAEVCQGQAFHCVARAKCLSLMILIVVKIVKKSDEFY